jgi:transposase
VPCETVKQCECGGAVESDHVLPQRHQQVEIAQIKLKWREYLMFSGICQQCGRRHWGELPPGVPAGMLGPRAMAVVALLSGTFHLSKRLIKDFFALILGLELSLGTVSNTEARVSRALEQPVEEARSFVQRQPVVNGDETGHKQAGKPAWVWVAATPLVCAFLIRASRKTEVAKELLGEAFRGLLISDRYSGYNWIDTLCRQLCWAHLQRDLNKISDRGGRSQQIADEILEYIYEMWHLWHRFKAGERGRPWLQRKMAPIREAVEDLLEQGTTCGHPKTQRTCKRILNVKAALWTFVDVAGVEPTNNFAERIIRGYVLWRKMCFGTQSERGNRFVERILTVTASCRLQQRNPIEYLVDALRAHFLGRPAPSLLPQEDQTTDLSCAA